MRYTDKGIEYFGETKLGTTRLERLRKQKGWSRNKLARRAKVSPSSIKKIETEGATGDMTLRLALSLAAALDTTAAVLFEELIPPKLRKQFRQARWIWGKRS